MHSLDHRLYLDLNRLALHSPWMHGAARLYAAYVGAIAVALLIAWAWWRGRSSLHAPAAVATAAWALVAGLVSAGVAEAIAHAVARPRPFLTMPSVEVLGGRIGSFGFPDRWSAAAAAVAVALVLSDRALAAGAAVVAVLGAFSRVYIGANYPSDVVAGLALGAVLALALAPLGRSVLTWLAVKVERSPLHLLVAAPVPDPDRVAVPKAGVGAP